MKKCGFVIRVSTDIQARKPEGSLKNQLQKLRAHVEYKNTACGEKWDESAKYILEGVSGKESIRSPEFVRLFEDIHLGKVNTVLCTALDRISRSVKDFLNFFEILNKYNVEFVCLKQNYDTTSSQGKLFITIMMALAEFEREQTSERNKDATLARAERGLWNGGQILGYDLDPDKKGYLIPNEKEKAIVRFTYNTYLKYGSITKTAEQLNQHGYRTKEYTSRRGKLHPVQKFGHTSTQRILSNYAYLGIKEINKRKMFKVQEKLSDSEKYRRVPAVWEPLIDNTTFQKAQDLLKRNTVSKHNQTTAINHTYILNSGLLWCEKCGTEMQGTCGTGKHGIRYYYYMCKNKKCRFKLPANEIENVVVTRIKQLSTEKDFMTDMIKNANVKLQKELPQLQQQKSLLQKELEEVKNFASGILNEWNSLANDNNSLFIKEKLDQLGKRRKEIETGIISLDEMVTEIKREAVNQELVMLALSKFAEVFDSITPYQQKDLLRFILHKAYLGPKSIKIAIYGRPGEIWRSDDICKSLGELRTGTPEWQRQRGSNP